MTILDIPVKTLAGQDSSLGSAVAPGSAMLVVNVASKCGLTPQYTALEKLHEQFASRGLSVVGFPCNQFGGQEPGTADEIAEFCSATYGVTFPMFEKIEVNGPGRHAIYTELTAVPDAERRGRRHPVELREVPGATRRHGGGAIPSPDHARRPRGDRGHRGQPPADYYLG